MTQMKMKIPMKKKNVFQIVVAAFLTAASFGAEPFEIGVAMSEASFWETSFQTFEKAHLAHGFSATGDGEEGMDSCLDGAVTCFDLPVYETRVSFTEGGKSVARVELMLYAKSGTEKYIVAKDQTGRLRKFNRRRIEKPITRAGFSDILNAVRAKLTPPGAKEPQKETNNLKNKSFKQKSQTWPKTSLPSVATLTWNFSTPGGKSTAFAPGFVRLAVDGPSALAQKKPNKGVKTTKIAHGAKSIAANVVHVRDGSEGRGVAGDVFIDNIPMVDQGNKGYCAAATSERVLRYYGLDIDEHEIAQAAGTTAEGGTSSKQMHDSIVAVGKRFKLATVVAYGDLDKSTADRIKSFTKEVDAYNKTARKLKRKEIGREVYIFGHTVNPQAFDAAMEPEVRMELKCRGIQKTKYKKFMTDVKQQIDRGIPLFWGVMLGIFPEPDIPQAVGGHARLIIGYNTRTNEIIYTDSWGRGHEFKRMSADKAFTIARYLMYMRPLR